MTKPTIPTFDPSMFVDFADNNLIVRTADPPPSPYSRAGKAKFANHFAKFVARGFPATQWTKSFYRRLSGCGQHIAHYDAGGFWSEWFASTASKTRFVRHWSTMPIYGDPRYTYSDVERVLSDWLRSARYLEYWESQLFTEVRQSELQSLAFLKAKYE